MFMLCRLQLCALGLSSEEVHVCVVVYSMKGPQNLHGSNSRKSKFNFMKPQVDFKTIWTIVYTLPSLPSPVEGQFRLIVCSMDEFKEVSSLSGILCKHSTIIK